VPGGTDRTGRDAPGRGERIAERSNIRSIRRPPGDCSKVAILQSDWSRATLLQSPNAENPER